MRTTVY
ncbi:unnamed protein product, partial [Rotaria sp. Silwood2]